MEYLDKYIPKELLALKINYCRKRLRELPKFSVSNHLIRGVQTKIIRADNHKNILNSPKGQALYAAMIEREELEFRLKIYEAIWDRYYRTPVLALFAVLNDLTILGGSNAGTGVL